MITEEAYGEYSAECNGCPKRELGRRRDDGSVYAFSVSLRRAGWKRTNFQFRDFGDTYRLWCPDCWPLVRALPNFDRDGNWVHDRACPDWAHARNGHQDACAHTMTTRPDDQNEPEGATNAE